MECNYCSFERKKKHMNKHRLTTKFYKWKSIPKEL